MFTPSQLYTHEEIYRQLGVGNAGGIRTRLDSSGAIQRMVLFTSVASARIKGENPYHDRIEGDTLVYTGAGQEGHQTLSGSNKNIFRQEAEGFPIYCFQLITSRRSKETGPKRWKFLGLLRYLRCYKEVQVDARLTSRDTWIFEFRIHADFREISLSSEQPIVSEILTAARAENTSADDNVVVTEAGAGNGSLFAPVDFIRLESTRRRMLALDPAGFEHLIKDVLILSGFTDVSVTQYSQDGGIDVNATVGPAVWPLRSSLVQVQAKRWLHTVGRKEVAELRGSLQAYASGAIVTTSHFSRAALAEACENGKRPINLVDGHQFAHIVDDLEIAL